MKRFDYSSSMKQYSEQTVSEQKQRAEQRQVELDQKAEAERSSVDTDETKTSDQNDLETTVSQNAVESSVQDKTDSDDSVDDVSDIQEGSFDNIYSDGVDLDAQQFSRDMTEQKPVSAVPVVPSAKQDLRFINLSNKPEPAVPNDTEPVSYDCVGEKPRKPVIQSRPTSMRQTSSQDEMKTSSLRDIPTVLIDRIRALFPAATTQGDAVSAYIYVKEGMPADIPVPDKIRRIADSYTGDVMTLQDATTGLSNDIQSLRQNDKLVMQKLNAIELAIVYSIFDRAGFRHEMQTAPGELKFLENGVETMMTQLEQQALNKQMKDANRAGCPIRK